MSVRFLRSVNPDTAAGGGRKDRHLAQIKDHQELVPYQGQLWLESLRIFNGLFALVTDFAVILRIKKQFSIIASFMFIPNERNTDLSKEINPES